jgi:hypothetical protein
MVTNIMDSHAYRNGNVNQSSHTINATIENLEALQIILEKKGSSFSLKYILLGIIDVLSTIFGSGPLGTKLLVSGVNS